MIAVIAPLAMAQSLVAQDACDGTSVDSCTEVHTDPGCDNVVCCTFVCAVEPACCDIGWDQLCVDITTSSAECGGGGGGNAENDTCLDAIPILLGETPYSTLEAGGTGDHDESCGDYATTHGPDIWYTFEATTTGTLQVSTCDTADYDTRLGAWDICGGTLIACNDDGAGCTGFTSIMYIEIESAPSTTYIQVAGYGDAVGTGTLNLEYVVLPDPPANDECVDAIDVPVDSEGNGQAAFDTTWATNSPEIADESLCLETFLGTVALDVWYSVIVPSGQTSMSFTTCDANSYDTSLMIYMAGTDCSDMIVIGCNGDAPDSTGCQPFHSEVEVTGLAGGEKLYVRIGAYGAGAGTGTLNIGSFEPPPPPDNDECEGAVELVDGDNLFDLTYATGVQELPDPLCDEGYGLFMGLDVWYTLSPTCDGDVTLNLSNEDTTIDTRLAVFDACAGTLIACNDDGAECECVQSQLTFAATCDTVYIVALGVFSDGTAFSAPGTGNLQVSCAGTECGGAPDCPGDFNEDGTVGAQDVTAMLSGWGTPDYDLNDDGTTGAQDITALLTYWGACPTG